MPGLWIEQAGVGQGRGQEGKNPFCACVLGFRAGFSAFALVCAPFCRPCVPMCPHARVFGGRTGPSTPILCTRTRYPRPGPVLGEGRGAGFSPRSDYYAQAYRGRPEYKRTGGAGAHGCSGHTGHTQCTQGTWHTGHTQPMGAYGRMGLWRKAHDLRTGTGAQDRPGTRHAGHTWHKAWGWAHIPLWRTSGRATPSRAGGLAEGATARPWGKPMALGA